MTMLAKAIRNRRSVRDAARDFLRRLRYACAKACAVALQNLAGLWQDATMQMNVAASLNRRVRRPCYHLVLSWPAVETPSDRELIGAAHRAMTEMGASDYQYVIAVHRDTPQIHVHIVLNRIHPETGVTLSLSHDYARLEHACRIIEHAFGWPPDRGRFQPELVDGEIRLAPLPAAHWQAKLARRAKGWQRDLDDGQVAPRDPFAAELLDRARTVFQQARNWAALHAGLIGHGLRYLRHRFGGRLEHVRSGETMAAGDLGSAYTLPRLEASWGSYRAGPEVAIDRLGARARSGRAYREGRAARRQLLAELEEQQNREETQLSVVAAGLSALRRRALRRVLRQDHKLARARLRAALPLPRLADYGLTSRAPGQDARRSRGRRWARQVTPVQALDHGVLDHEALDHTALRQAWAQADALSAGGGADLRMTEDGALLVPRRNGRGSVVGVDRFRQTEAGVDYQLSGCSALGVALLGPHEAQTCIIVADGATGAYLSGRFPAVLIAVTGPSLSLWTEAQLLELARDRWVYAHDSGAAEDQPLLDRLEELLPDIRIRALDANYYCAETDEHEAGQDAPDEAWEGDLPGAEEPGEEDDFDFSP
ncbi:relaxase/mobilization nuclease domain-containing protein [Paracoccus jeotgali]|uniref:MobA/VirD2-like nuclease domain-containing protein n=1 Tax=Paracoccus jeotgali TaxID=2065379 RepID=A0A2K9MJH2_9RHOB|nr:relaxase/mobilization nuclease domain-containing protein [Paracoccus jeotgali]AUM75799.1 hypothetical protein CYR75_15350 [Paracoccus jeotgali]